jgi:hypothetical protein
VKTKQGEVNPSIPITACMLKHLQGIITAKAVAPFLLTRIDDIEEVMALV